MDADVVVIGGGPVGAALGMLLRGQGMRALVLDRAEFPRDKPCGEGLMPFGATVLRGLGVDLERQGFPAVTGVRYRLGEDGCGGNARAAFRGGPGFGVRRVRLDEILAARAGVRGGVRVTGLRALPGGVHVETSRGELWAAAVVGADGLRSSVRGWMGWDRAPRPPNRYALVGHVGWDGPARDEIAVTLLGEVEVYTAPAGASEMLAAVLGPKGSLRRSGLSVAESYRAAVARAQPELSAASLVGRVWGAGPFNVAPLKVAEGRAFLAGDAAGFLDPLTGEAMSAGLAQAFVLAGFLAQDLDSAAARYRRWSARQWRRRRFVSRMALTLTGSQALARRALGGVRHRPGALEALLEVNDGSRGLAALRPRDWAALAGL